MSEFASGGIVTGPQSPPVTIARVGSTAEGHCLYSINGGSPERIIPRTEAAAIVRRGLNALNAPRLWEGDQA